MLRVEHLLGCFNENDVLILLAFYSATGRRVGFVDLVVDAFHQHGFRVDSNDLGHRHGSTAFIAVSIRPCLFEFLSRFERIRHPSVYPVDFCLIRQIIAN